MIVDDAELCIYEREDIICIHIDGHTKMVGGSVFSRTKCFLSTSEPIHENKTKITDVKYSLFIGLMVRFYGIVSCLMKNILYTYIK